MGVVLGGPEVRAACGGVGGGAVGEPVAAEGLRGDVTQQGARGTHAVAADGPAGGGVLR